MFGRALHLITLFVLLIMKNVPKRSEQEKIKVRALHLLGEL